MCLSLFYLINTKLYKTPQSLRHDQFYKLPVSATSELQVFHKSHFDCFNGALFVKCIPRQPNLKFKTNNISIVRK